MWQNVQKLLNESGKPPALKSIEEFLQLNSFLNSQPNLMKSKAHLDSLNHIQKLTQSIQSQSQFASLSSHIQDRLSFMGHSELPNMFQNTFDSDRLNESAQNSDNERDNFLSRAPIEFKANVDNEQSRNLVIRENARKGTELLMSN
jgi:hypothetical protein